MQLLLALERWLNDTDMDPELADCIVEYVQRRGQETGDNGGYHSGGIKEVQCYGAITGYDWVEKVS